MNANLRSVVQYASVVGALWLWVRCEPGWDPLAAEPSFHLTGHHDGVACESCHPADQPLGPLPTDCASCHDAGFTACASCHEPDRPSGHFPGDCGECHNPITWEGATFDHDFPRGHANANDCADCHPGGDTTTFSCLNGCHTNRAELAGEHDEAGNYQYESGACLGCHPKGQD